MQSKCLVLTGLPIAMALSACAMEPLELGGDETGFAEQQNLDVDEDGWTLDEIGVASDLEAAAAEYGKVCRQNQYHRKCIVLDVDFPEGIRARASITSLSSGTQVKVNDVRLQQLVDGTWYNNFNNPDDDGWHQDSDHAHNLWSNAACAVEGRVMRARARFEEKRGGTNFRVYLNSNSVSGCPGW